MDAFNFMPLLNNLLFAADAVRDWPETAPVPWQGDPFTRIYEEAGLWIINTEHYYAIVGLSKGGTVSVFDKGRRELAARHSGYFTRWHGKTYASQDYTLRPNVRWSADQRSAELQVPWKAVSHRVFSPCLFVCFRLFTLTLGRFPAVSRWIKHLLVKVLIRRKHRAPIYHRRWVELTARGIKITDEIRLPPGVDAIVAASQFTAIHMGSSMYCDIRSLRGSAQTYRLPVVSSTAVKITGTLSLDGVSWGAVGA